MPFRSHARITVTNEGKEKVDAFYFNIDMRQCHALPADVLYFHAQYRQAAPNKGWTSDWQHNWDANVDTKKNLNGEGNYVWMEATGKGQYIGVTMSVLQNQDGWWGEGDDMFFIDGESYSVDQRDRIRGLLPGSLGLRPHFILVSTLWCPGEGRRVRRIPLFRISLSP